MEKNSNASIKSSEKINLSNIYTEKELDSLKKIFPNLSSLIITYPSKLSNNSSPNKSSKISQFIEKDKFVKLIIDKMLHSLKGENSEILAKSFELMLNDNNIQKKEEKQNKRKTVKIAKNHILVDYNEKSKINGEVIFPTKIPKKNILLDKYINSTKNKNSVNVNFNLRNINNNPLNKTGKKKKKRKRKKGKKLKEELKKIKKK